MNFLVFSYAGPVLKDPRGLRATLNAYFTLLRHIKNLLFVTFFDMTAKLKLCFGHTDGMMDEQTDFEVEVVTD